MDKRGPTSVYVGLVSRRLTLLVDENSHTVAVQRGGPDCLVSFAEGEQQLRVSRLGPSEYLLIGADHRVRHLIVDQRDDTVHVFSSATHHQVGVLNERVIARRRATSEQVGHGGSITIRAPMPGRVVKHLVSVGDHVDRGQGVIVIEAMKMENEIRADIGGVVCEFFAGEGSDVESSAKLLVIDSRPNAVPEDAD